MTPTRPQEFNVPILTLARERGSLREADIHFSLALAIGVERGFLTAAAPAAAWRFSAMVNIAKRRLLRYGLLRVADDLRIGITPLGQLFLSRGLTRLDPRTRQALLHRGPSRSKIA